MRNVSSRYFSPLKIVTLASTVIVVLIGVGFNPPDGRSNHFLPPPGSGANGGAVTPPAVPTDQSTAAGLEGGTETVVARNPRASARATGTPTKSRPTKSPKRDGGSRTSKPPSSNDGDGGAGAGADDGVPTVDCPAVKSHLPAIPAGAKADVDQNLAQLKQQIADANARLAELAQDPVDDPNFVQNTILGPLRDNRIATLDRITIAIGRFTTPPSNLGRLAPCTV